MPQVLLLSLFYHTFLFSIRFVAIIRAVIGIFRWLLFLISSSSHICTFFFQHYACQLTKRHEFLRKLKKIDFNTKTVRFLMTLQKRGLEKLDHQPIIRYIGFSQILEHSFNSLETLGGR